MISYDLQISIFNEVEIAHTGKKPKEQKIRNFVLHPMANIPLAKDSGK